MIQTDRLNKIRLWAAERGITLFRNNVGVLKDAKGHHIRYGLHVGSGDLIGWRTIEIYGRRVAQFVSIEEKSPKDNPTTEQVLWRDAIKAAGGIAVIITDVKELEGVL